MVNLRTENRVDVLRQAAVLLERENARLIRALNEVACEVASLKGKGVDGLQLEIARLREQLDARERALFGASTERSTGGGTDKNNAASRPEKPAQQGHGPKEQRELLRDEKVHELDEADRVCTSCGGELVAMAGQFEESEEVDVLKRQFVLVRHKRQKYRCACGSCIETALGQKKLQPRGRYSIDFAIEVALSKYNAHLPLERQVKLMRREGLRVDSQTLWDQIEALARHLEGIPKRIRQHLLMQACIGADETHWRMMDKRGQDKGVNKRWYVWSLCGDDGVYYSITDNRSADSVTALVGDYDGVLVTDGYKAYSSAKTKNGAKYTSAFCWAHVRRYFLAAQKAYPREAGVIVHLIDELFAIDRRLREKPPDDPLDARRRASKPVLAALQHWAMTLKVLPDTAMGNAFAYMTKLWTGLVRFLDDACIPLSNNHTERAQRGVVVGRKNHYGSHSRRGTEVAALFYSIIESCQLVDVDPGVYIRAAVDARLEQAVQALPHDIKTA